MTWRDWVIRGGTPEPPRKPHIFAATYAAVRVPGPTRPVAVYRRGDGSWCWACRACPASWTGAHWSHERTLNEAAHHHRYCHAIPTWAPP